MDVPRTENSENDIYLRAKAISEVLNSSLRVADFRCSLFVSALLTYRRPTCLKPFPQTFVKDGNEQYDKLMKLFEQIPPLNVLREKLNDINYISDNPEIINILFYIIIEISEPNLTLVSNDSFESILQKVQSETDVCKPQYIFEVSKSPSSQIELKWKKDSAGKKTFYAYHGSKFENFHSILHHGLHQHMNKIGLYGSGIYLSSEHSISLHYSPCSLNWENSCLGRYLSCMALCELIDTPDGLISQKSVSSEESSENSINSNTKALDSLAGEIPQKYHIVYKNDIVRVRYLLVYAKKIPTLRNRYNPASKKTNLIMKYVRKYKFFSLMIFYFGILIILGFRNNNLVNYYYKVLSEKLISIFN